MTYTILCDGKYTYAYRKPTRAECNHYIRNGYSPPGLVREYDRDAYEYVRGKSKPNYPVPAIPLNTVLYSDVYIGCMYIERLNYGGHDPVIVYLYDSWNDVSEYTD